MKVKKLIDILNKQNPEDEVILSKDSEGNSFSPLADFSEDLYVPETKWYGEIHIKKLTDKLKEQGFSEEDLYGGDDGINCITLWPVN